MNGNSTGGFTLVEMLVTIAVLAVVAAVLVPLMSSGDKQKLDVAAEETANLLRFAISEAQRTGGYILVDGKTNTNTLALYYSNAGAQMPPSGGTAVVIDPLTKRAARLDPAGSAFSQGVSLLPQFRAAGAARPQLLIGPGLSKFQGFDGGALGLLEANSGVLLGYGGQGVSVGIDEKTGRVTLP